MQRNKALVTAGTSNDSKPAPESLNSTGFLNEAEILRLVPVSRRTLGTWKARGIIPFVRIGRRIIYRWADVETALLRRQRSMP